jgi:TerC family integral membrane protein
VIDSHPPAVWITFFAIIGALLLLDAVVLSRRAQVATVRESAAWTAGLVAVAALFGALIWWRESGQPALEFTTGYLVEVSLSVDNLFVFLVLFRYFGVPEALQPRALQWGILGAMVLRGIVIALGAAVLHRFAWVLYLLGAMLLITGLRFLLAGEIAVADPEQRRMVRMLRRVLPLTGRYDGPRLVTRIDGRRMATLLLLVILVIEWTDLMFAIDSIPAIFAITRDSFIVYSSNVFAIMGLRAVFFLLAGTIDSFRYLKLGVAIILMFIGVKMLLAWRVTVPIAVSLAVVVTILLVSTAMSLLGRRRAGAPGS